MTIWIREWNAGSPVVPASLCVLLSCLCVARFFFEQRARWLIAAGFGTGMAMLFRHDIGLYTFLSATVVGSVFVWKRVASNGEPVFVRLWTTARTWSPYCAGTMAAVLPVALFFLLTVPPRNLLFDLVLFPLFGIVAYRALPLPTPLLDLFQWYRGEVPLSSYAVRTANWFELAFPVVMFAGTGLAFGRDRRRRRPLSEREWFALFMLVLGVAFTSQLWHRLEPRHLMPAIVPAVILAPWLVAKLSEVGSRPSLRAVCDVGVLLYLFAFVASVYYPRLLTFYVIPYATPMVSLDLERARGVMIEANEGKSLTDAVRFIQTCVPRGERIFVGNAQHEQIFMNNVMFYFLADRHSASRHFMLEPGLTTTRPIQESIIRDLRAKETNYIVIWTVKQLRESNKSGESSGVADLDEFVRRNYHMIRCFGDYEILHRLEGAPDFPRRPRGVTEACSVTREGFRAKTL